MAGRYQKYPNYKDSGVEWIGDIPESWSMWKVAHAFNEIGSGTTPPTGNEELFKGDIPWITTGELRENIILETKKKLSNTAISMYPTLRKYPVGSIAIAMYGATIGRLGIFGVEATTNQACCVMPKSSQIFNKYLFYWLYACKEDIIRLSSGGGQPNINQEKVASLKVSSPVYEEQQKIAKFLDYETAKIDTLIAKQEKLIELLKEKRQAVISHAVIRGLNPNAPMKESGVEWLGEVPQHWELKKFKYLFKVRKRIAGELGYSVLSITQKGIKIKDTSSGDGQLSMDYSKYQLVYQGDFAMNHMDLLTGFVDISNYDGVTSPDYRVFTLEHKECSPLYFLNILQMGYLNKIFYPLGQGAAHIGRWRLPTEAFNEFYAPFPPKNEQEDISKFISATFNKIDSLLEKSAEAILLMKERKAALISSAVTGKIDVRNWSQT